MSIPPEVIAKIAALGARFPACEGCDGVVDKAGLVITAETADAGSVLTRVGVCSSCVAKAAHIMAAIELASAQGEPDH